LVFSKAHIETLNSYLEGGSIKEMAHRIFLSEATVKKHLSEIREKLKLASNNQIIDFLRKHHWCDFKTGKLICF
jgi:DNA-binding NarL/FixJ family response regulator|tara:strand:- start:557 stop:778 length:222 start_codon:yes stop_codon:yes gene_type:complete